MKFIDSAGVAFDCAVEFNGTCTFSDPPPGISLDDLVSLTGTGTFTAADLIATDDVTVGDDLVVTGLATIGETLAVTGNITGSATVQGADLIATDDLTVGDDAAISGAVTIGETLGVTGTTTLAAASATTLTASTSLVVTGASVVGLHEHITLTRLPIFGGGVYYVASPVAGTITKIQSIVGGETTATGATTITAAIGGVGVTDGVVTIASGAVEGEVDVANPTAANTVAVGSSIGLTVAGTNSAEGAQATLTITVLRSA